MFLLIVQVLLGNLIIFINAGFNIKTIKSFRNLIIGTNTLLFAAVIYLLFLPFLRILI